MQSGSATDLLDTTRLSTLRRAGLLDSPPEEAFDRLTRLAARVLRAPVALVSLVAADRQFFKSQVGLPEPWATQRQTSLGYSFCQYAVTSRQPLIVEDAREHPLVQNNLATPELGAVAYAGIPLITSDGQALGAFCVVDSCPRTWSDDDIAILRDLAASVVTEIELRLAADKAVTLAAERQAVLAQTAEGVIVADAEGFITFVNEAARRLHGSASLDVPLSQWSDAFGLLTVDGRPYPPEELPLGRAVQRGETVADATWRVRRPDGSEVVVQGTASPLVDADGACVGAVLVMRDVTAHHELERQKVEFLSAAAHDLNNPVAAVKTAAQLLRRRLARPEPPPLERIASGLEQIETIANRMGGLVTELLDLAHLRMARPIDLHRRPVDLVALVRRSIGEFRHASDRHQIVLEAGVPELVGSFDAGRLARALDNLIGNAIKFSPDGGEVRVTVAYEPPEPPPSPAGGAPEAAGAESAGVPGGDAAGGPAGWAVLAVRDQGMGIPAAEVSRVFEQFARGSNVQGKVAGTGLGLTAVRQIVEQHGGTIAVESTEGHGSTFTLRLPLVAPEEG